MKEKGKEEVIANYRIKDVQIEEIVPNKINGVLITVNLGMHSLDIPPEMTGEQFSRWRKGKGGVFSKDVYLWTIDKPTGKYILLEGEGERSILRLIEENEFEKFESYKLIDGKVKDKPYMKLLDLPGLEVSEKKIRYIEENDQKDILNDLMISKTNHIPLEEEASSDKNIALFEN